MPSVPGKGGQMPKRSAERMGHRTKAEKESVEKVQVRGAVVAPPVADHWHEIAHNWYVALKKSGQARFFEPSDWAAAQYVAEVMTRNLYAGRFSGQLFAAAWAAMNDLLTTEGARRRLRLELERANAGPSPEEAQAVAVMADYRNTIAN